MTRTQDRLNRLESAQARTSSAPVYLVDSEGRTTRPVEAVHQTIVLLSMKQEHHQ